MMVVVNVLVNKWSMNGCKHDLRVLFSFVNNVLNPQLFRI
jgi:hypothetical protein